MNNTINKVFFNKSLNSTFEQNFIPMLKRLSLYLILTSTLLACVGGNNAENNKNGIVNVYTHRHYEIDKQIFKDFQKETGIQVNVISANSDELIMRMENEGEFTPADLLITVDAARLARAKNKKLLQAITEQENTKNIPSTFKDKDLNWLGLTYRARLIVADKQLENLPKTYANLASDEYTGMVAMRSSENEYNQSLLAGIVAHIGADSALQWAKNVVSNFARDPKGNDRDQIKTIAAGMAKLSVVNSYYLGKMHFSANEDEKKALDAVTVIFPDQADGENGTHINISGVGLSKYSKNKANALKLINYLCSVKIQEAFAEANYEYPTNPKAQTNGFLKSLGNFRADTLDLAKLGEYNAKAVELFQKAKWN